MPSNATITVVSSEQERRPQKRGTTFRLATYRTCSSFPQLKRFEMVKAASLLIMTVAEPMRSTRRGTISASITLWIWATMPAVILERANRPPYAHYHFHNLKSSSERRARGKSNTTCICWSVPLTMFPSVDSAGIRTIILLWLRCFTRQGTTAASFTTNWMSSFVMQGILKNAQNI